MIQIVSISKGFGGHVLFRDVDWDIGDRERIGLVGPNGAGKTTLCRILARVDDPDTGQVSLPRSVTVGYLPQEAAGSASGSVLAEALGGFEAVWALEREMEDVARALETTPDDALTERYGELQHRFDALGGYRLESQARVILSGLGFRVDELTRPLAEFSGGWRMRASLARLLLVAPSLLLLDEPTNHLDLASLAWLENFLSGYDGTVVVVSHDRYFLNRMVTSIADLTPDGLVVYPGDYDDFLVEREARRELLRRARDQAKRIAEVERFIERFRYQATKARQVQSRIKALEKVERLNCRLPARDPIRVSRAAAHGPPGGDLTDVHKAYGDNVVYSGVSVAVERGDRVALVGDNAPANPPCSRCWPACCRSSAVSARSAPTWPCTTRAASARRARCHAHHARGTGGGGAGGQHTRLRTILGAFLFSGDSVDKRVGVLSGGEKARLALARMLVRPAALLCLDEPTNHLDLASREVLESALAGFPGTIVFISHDRYFINRIATVVVEVASGVLTNYPGSYDDYLEAKARGVQPTPAAPTPSARPADHRGAPATADACRPRPPGPAGGCGGRAGGRRPGDGAASAPAPQVRVIRKRGTAEIRELKRRVEDLERQIHALERRIAEIGAMLTNPKLYIDGDRVRAVSRERKEAEERMSGLLREWEDLATSLAGHE